MCVQIKFLRQMEQEEWSERPKDARGQVATIRSYNGVMAGRWSLNNVGTEGGGAQPDAPAAVPAPAASGKPAALAVPAPAAAAAAQPATPAGQKPVAATASPRKATEDSGKADEDSENELDGPRDAPDGDDVVGGEVHHGVCGLLYTPLQLHTTGRKLSQVALIQVCNPPCVSSMLAVTAILEP
jgi:hypothetical protein